ncbi:MAG: hypothetical protein RLY66_414, partial [Candidatus Parcubacteria bacterium]
AGNYDNCNGYDYTYRVYPYKTVAGQKVFSTTYTQSNTDTDDGLCDNSIYIDVSWSAVSGANGYRVFVNNPAIGASYDYYYDTTSTSFADGDGVEASFVAGTTVTPTSIGPVLVADTNTIRLGVGTSTPGSTLSVNGNAQITSGLTVGGLTTVSRFDVFTNNSGYSGSNDLGSVRFGKADGTIKFRSDWDDTYGTDIEVRNAVGTSAFIGSSVYTNPSSAYADDRVAMLQVKTASTNSGGGTLHLLTHSAVADNFNYNINALYDGSVALGSAGGNDIVSTPPSSKVWIRGNAAIGTTASAVTAPTNGLYVQGGVGIGTSTPYAKLSVVGQVAAEYFSATSTTATSTFSGGLVAAGSGGLNVLQNGNVGIGTTSPYAKLSVVGEVVARNFTATSTTATSTFAGGFSGPNSFTIQSSSGKVGVGTTSPFAQLSVSTAAQQSGLLPLFTVASTTNLTLFNILGNGNVGIGTTSPYAKLSVAGQTVSEYFTATSTTATSTLPRLTSTIFNNTGATYLASSNGTVNIGANTTGTSKLTINTSNTSLATTCTSAVILCLNNTSGGDTDQTNVMFMGNNTLRGGIRADYFGDFVYYGNVPVALPTGGISFFPNGDYPNAMKMNITSTGVVIGENILSQAPDANLSVKGVAKFRNDGNNQQVGIGVIDSDGSGNVICSSTCFFQSQMSVGDRIDIDGFGLVTVTSITDDSNLTIDSDGGPFSGAPFTFLPSYAIKVVATGYTGSIQGGHLGWYDSGGTKIMGELSSDEAIGAPHGSFNLFGNSSEYAARLGEWNVEDRSLLPSDARAFTMSIDKSPVTAGYGMHIYSRPSSFAAVAWFDSNSGLALGSTYALSTTPPANGLIVEGNTGIGTTSSVTAKLTSLSTTLPQLSLSGGSTISQIVFRNAGGNFYLATTTVAGATTTTPSAFTIMGATGNVGIGTTTPWKKFSVVGTAAFNGLTAAAVSGDALCLSAGKEMVVNTGAQTCTVSSARFKNSIETLDSGLAALKQLNPVSFKYNGSDDRRIGFIAEQVGQVDRRLIFTEADGTTPRGVRYEDMVAVVVNAVKEQQVQIGDIASSTVGLKNWKIEADTSLASSNQTLQSLASAIDASNSAISTLEQKVAALASTTEEIASNNVEVNISEISSTISTDISFIQQVASSTAALIASSTIEIVASTTAERLATSTPFITTIATAVKEMIRAAGEWAVDKLTAHIVYADRVETQVAAISKGLEMTDATTGEVYCIQIDNGDWNKRLGSCDEQAAPAQVPAQSIIEPQDEGDTTATSTPSIIEDSGGDDQATSTPATSTPSIVEDSGGDDQATSTPAIDESTGETSGNESTQSSEETVVEDSSNGSTEEATVDNGGGETAPADSSDSAAGSDTTTEGSTE